MHLEARWTTVANVPSRSIANSVAAVLQDAGLATRIVSDDGGGVFPQLDTASGGVQVQVPDADAEGSRELLADFEELAATPVGSRNPVVTWRALGILLLAIAMAVTVGGAFLP